MTHIPSVLECSTALPDVNRLRRLVSITRTSFHTLAPAAQKHTEGSGERTVVPRVHPNLTCRGAGCISSRLPSPAAAEGHVPAPNRGLHNGTTQPARVRRGSTGLKVVDNSQVCANSLEFYIEANII